MARILVITPDVLAPQMAGPAIRAFHIAAALAADMGPDGAGHAVTLVSAASCTLTDDKVDCRFVGWHEMGRFAADFDVLILQGFASYHAPALLTGDQVVVVDLYDPLQFEQLEQQKAAEKALRRNTIDLTVRVLNAQAARGDLFLCASEEQRQLWLGMLSALGRVNPDTYDRDPSLRSLVEVVPFGVGDAEPMLNTSAIRGRAGIGAEDKIALWAGGVYNWFDPLSLIRAVAKLAPRRPDVRLFFMGMGHPNPDLPEMSMSTAARTLAAELGLVDKHVFFNEGWVPFEQRADYLLDADIGVSTHFDHAETAFAFRTRMLDYLWAGLPILATEGDVFGRLIAEQGLGIVVAEQDVDGLAAGLEQLLYDAEFADTARGRVQQVRESFRWERTLAPLVEFCRQPRRAADTGADPLRIVRRPVPPSNPIVRAIGRARALRAEGGFALVVTRIRGKLARMRG